MFINHNIPALKAYGDMKKTGASFAKTMSSLTSGLRINHASDDASGLAVSERLRAQLYGIDQAMQNSQDGMSMLQTAEGALEQTTAMLQRMRELSVQAANDTLTVQDRGHIQLEISELKKEIDKTAKTTQFNKRKLLNGDAGVLWSSSNSGVSARINGGLLGQDAFNQKVNEEGNYRLEIKASAGKAQVQKTNFFRIEKDSTSDEEFEININTGIDVNGLSSGKGWEFSGGVLHITGNGKYTVVGSVDANGNTIATNNWIHIDDGVKADVIMRDVNIEATQYAFYMAGANVNLWLDSGEHDNVNRLVSASSYHCAALQAPEGSILTITSLKGDGQTDGKLYTKGSIHSAGIGGACNGMGRSNPTAGSITINGGTIEAQGGILGAGIGGGWRGHGGTITINGGIVKATGGDGGAGIGAGGYYNSTSSNFNSGTVTISGGTVEAQGGDANSNGTRYSFTSVGQGAGIGGGGGFTGGTIKIDSSNASVTVTGGYTDASQTESIGYGQYGTSANISYESLTPTSTVAFGGFHETKLCTLDEIDAFYTSEGRFIVEEPQSLVIHQADGNSASVTLYQGDTMYDVAEKINNAIANDLGQAKYTDNATKFCTIANGVGASEAASKYDGDMLTASTMIVRSAVSGKAGELSFSGSEELLNALGLNTIQESSESEYTVSVYDAHSGEILTKDAKVTGNIAHGLVNQNIDVEFDTMSGVIASWNEASKSYKLNSTGTFETTLHLSDNSIVIQKGANEAEDLIVSIGDMSTKALGLDDVNVFTRESAARSVTIIDEALDHVMTQRAKIGAYENILEHNISRLQIASENITNAESQIRDADMAKVMMEYVKLQIKDQAESSVMLQANQAQQSVMSLFR